MQDILKLISEAHLARFQKPVTMASVIHVLATVCSYSHLLLAVTIKILSKSVAMMWRCGLATSDALGVIRNLFPGCPTQQCNGQCSSRFWIGLFYSALSFIFKTGLSLLNKYTDAMIKHAIKKKILVGGMTIHEYKTLIYSIRTI